MKRLRARMTYANVVSTLALFLVVAGGTAWAAEELLPESVGTAELKANAVTGPKVKNGSLRAADFAANQLPEGPEGPQGEKGEKGEPGPQGDPGPVGPAGGVSGYLVVEKHTPDSPQDEKLMDAICPPGLQVIGGGAFINGFSEGVAMRNSTPETGIFGTQSGWFATAFETKKTTEKWELVVKAICARAAS